MFHPVAQCTDCQIRMTSGTNMIETGYQFKWNSTTPPSVPELLSLATEMKDTVGEALRKCLSNGTTFREIHCRNLDAENGNQATYSYPNGIVGDRFGFQVAANEAAGVVKRTGQSGRGSHGRNSISTFAEGDVDGNTLSNQLLALLADLALRTLATAVSNRFIPAIAHRPRILGPAGTATPIIAALVLDSNVDSQKTRLNAHGR